MTINILPDKMSVTIDETKIITPKIIPMIKNGSLRCSNAFIWCTTLL